MSIMSPHPPSHRVSDVAALLGVSDDTVRRWIDQRHVRAAKDTTGRLRVDGASLAAFLVTQQQERQDLADGAQTQSMRNHIRGIVAKVISDKVMLSLIHI